MTDVRLSRDLALLGLNADERHRMMRRGELTQIRRGAYLFGSEETDHRDLIAATVAQSSSEAVVSHSSAAVLHRLPIWSDQLQRVQLTRDRAGGGKTRRYLQVHGLPLSESEISDVDGYRVTSLARTVLDLGCQLSLVRSVGVGDAALRFGLRPEELAALIEDARRRHGIGRARQMAALLDARAESPEESRSRVLFHQHGLPAPTPQYLVFDVNGSFVARCDFGWPELGTVGEFDGKIKYGRRLRPGQDLEEVLFEEKRREDAVRAEDLQMVRWVSADLNQPGPLMTRLRQAFARGRPRPDRR